MKTFYISTAIDYVNSKPHLGHAYEKVCTDIIARWHRSLGEDVFFVTGTDENAQKNVSASKKEGMKVKDFVDMHAKNFKNLCEKYNISFDDFIRTTESRHKKVAQSIFQKMFDKGDIYKGFYEGLYCEGCEAYLTEKELINGKCPEHEKAPKYFKEETYFFKASKYEKRGLKLLESDHFLLPLSKRKEMVTRLKEEGIKDLCVSRKDLEWGIEVPFDKSQRIYVWKEALENYISCLGYPDNEKYKKYWINNSEKIHVIGKGINFFHSVVWPAVLLSAEIPLPKTILVHGYINIAGKKMSKSKGVVVDPLELVKQYPLDSIRYYFCRHIPFGQDGDFSYETLEERHNSELVNDLGNLHSRTLSMVERYFKGKVKGTHKDELVKKLNFKKINEQMLNYELNKALSDIWKFINESNKYINDQKPWELAKRNKEKLEQVMYNLLESLRIISILVEPFMPTTAKALQKDLKIKNQTFKDIKFGLGKYNSVKKSDYLFTKIEEKQEEEPVKKREGKKMVKFEDWEKLELKTATIIKAEPHPKADKLLVLQVDLGDEKRQIVAGIKEHYKPAELKGKTVIVITNLQPAKLRGIESQGMLLAASLDKELGLVTVDKKLKPGATIS
jgi:methionyl-tRNA synthetase